MSRYGNRLRPSTNRASPCETSSNQGRPQRQIEEVGRQNVEAGSRPTEPQARLKSSVLRDNEARMGKRHPDASSTALI